MQRPFSKAVFFLKKGAICNSIMDIEFSLAELEQLAGKLAQIIDGRKVVAIHGQMGAGKTCPVYQRGEATVPEGHRQSVRVYQSFGETLESARLLEAYTSLCVDGGDR